jgi:hypothetical protein
MPDRLCGAVLEYQVAKVSMSVEASGSASHKSYSSFSAPAKSPASLRSLDSVIGSENGSAGSSQGSTCSISNCARGRGR